MVIPKISGSPLKDQIKLFSFVKVINFVQPEELPTLMMKAGIFVIPSIKEPWGLVIHEAAALGMPIIASKNCGAASTFVREGENGYLFDPLKQESLENAIWKITNKSESDLVKMGEISHQLSSKITQDIWASVLYNVIKGSK